ncbi:MAG: nitroreductase family protein [Armatimonadota bacterium]|nr:MAG: nitroreductase family protein [Armatimonadota bacterium]
MALDTIVAIMQRRSVRKYEHKSIPDEDLHTIIEAGRNAPSAANRQPWHFIVIKDAEQRRKVAEACSDQHWMADAAVIVAGVGKPSVNEKWYPVDVAIAMQNMILSATALGYGTCWIGAFDDKRVADLLGVPEDMRVVALTPVGVPGDQPEPRPRQPLSEFASLDRYGKKLS